MMQIKGQNPNRASDSCSMLTRKHSVTWRTAWIVPVFLIIEKHHRKEPFEQNRLANFHRLNRPQHNRNRKYSTTFHVKRNQRTSLGKVQFWRQLKRYNVPQQDEPLVLGLLKWIEIEEKYLSHKRLQRRKPACQTSQPYRIRVRQNALQIVQLPSADVNQVRL